MHPETTLRFFDEAENRLGSIRRGILVSRQDDSTAELSEQLREIGRLKRTAEDLGFGVIGIVLEAFDTESIRIFRQGSGISDGDSRSLLDLLAHSEAEIVKARLGNDDNSIDDFIDNSFDRLRINAAPNRLPEKSEEPTVDDDGADEFEIDAEMLEIFALEAEELLSNIEANLEALAAEPANREALWEIRRHAHTFKGAAGIVGLKSPSKLAHRVEDLLDHLAQNEISPDPRVLELLNSSTSCLRSITAGDTSQTTSLQMKNIYSAFDNIMAAISQPQPATVLPNEVSIPAEKPVWPGDPHVAQPRPIVRVSISRLDELVRIVRDLVVNRSVVEQRMRDLEQQLEELHGTTRRLQATSAKIDTDFEASMLETQTVSLLSEAYAPADDDVSRTNDPEQFDSLELDRYTDFHQTSRELSEATSDSFSINTTLEAVKGSLEMVFDDQRRLVEEMQEKLMQIRLIEFGSLTTRLQRAVRVTCEEEGKRAEVTVENPEVELDTDVLDSMVEPLMHLLRNAVVHGIESPDTRRLLGKPEKGNIIVSVSNEETHVVLRVSDDGRGIAGSLLKEKAVSAGLLDPQSAELLEGDKLLDLMFLPGLTTAERLSISAGRGVGMSIVKESIEARNGSISVKTGAQRGTEFTVRIPLKYAVTQVLLVRVNSQTVAIPLKQVKHVLEIDPSEIDASGGEPILKLESETYPVRYAADHIFPPENADIVHDFLNTLLIETGDTGCALIVDEVLRSEEIAIKPFGKPLENLKGVFGAAILGSGDTVPILDLPFLLRSPRPDRSKPLPQTKLDAPHVLIVDDSPSVRHMTAKVVTGAGWGVKTAKDGREALEMLSSAIDLPSVVLTDIEMPRMDGYDLAAALRENDRFREIPIVLITSRTGEKHRDRAAGLGIEYHLAKPYEDSELISIIDRLAVDVWK